jgi:hypothetical protein
LALPAPRPPAVPGQKKTALMERREDGAGGMRSLFCHRQDFFQFSRAPAITGLN